MRPIHGRFPFLDSAREAVRAADADLAAIVGSGRNPVVERAVDRIVSAIEAGDVGDHHPSYRVELLSYPVARVLVSLVGDPALTARYARAEAATAHERLLADLEDAAELKSVSRERLTLADLLAEFDLADEVTVDGDAVSIAVAPYLRLAAEQPEERWRLRHRVLADGRVAATRDELVTLLREAVQDRVAAGLPHGVPDGIDEALAPEVERIRDRLETVDVRGGFDAVVPEKFPPCVDALLDRVAEGAPLGTHSRYALVAFLAATGMDTDEIVDRVADHPDVSEGIARYQVDHLHDAAGPTAYAPPSCASMQAYGDCVNRDALCATIAHPLEYYERRLDGADPAELADEADEAAEADADA